MTRESSLDKWGERLFETVAVGQQYRLTVPAIDLVFNLDRVRYDRGDLKGHLIVTTSMAGARTIGGGILMSSPIYISSAEARFRMAKMLADRAVAPDVDFAGLLEELAVLSEAADRRGAPPVRMSAVPLVAAEDELFNVHGLKLPKKHPTILYGTGDSFKSFILAMVLGELEISGVPTMLVDYELTAEDHRRRLDLLYGAKVPDFLHVRAERPMNIEIDRLLRLVHDHRIQYVAVDSVAFGCAGPPEQAEEALSFMRAVRRLNVGSLLIAHQAKGEGGDKTPFGSAFWFNSARSIYHVKRDEAGADGVDRVALYPTKSNLSRRGSAVGLEFTSTSTEVTVKRRDVADMGGDLAAKLTVSQRMRAVLKRGSMTISQLAEELGVPENTISVTVGRGSKENERRWLMKVPGPDGVYRIGLLAR